MSDTVTAYVPPGSDATVKPPSLPVTAVNSSPVPLFLILTSAPGMTAPDGSITVPDSDVKKLPCAYAAELAATTVARPIATAASHFAKLCFIECSIRCK